MEVVADNIKKKKKAIFGDCVEGLGGKKTHKANIWWERMCSHDTEEKLGAAESKGKIRAAYTSIKGFVRICL